MPLVFINIIFIFLALFCMSHLSYIFVLVHLWIFKLNSPSSVHCSSPINEWFINIVWMSGESTTGGYPLLLVHVFDLFETPAVMWAPFRLLLPLLPGWHQMIKPSKRPKSITQHMRNAFCFQCVDILRHLFL